MLVERYHEVVCEALHYVCAKNAVAQDIPTDAKLAFFNETRRDKKHQRRELKAKHKISKPALHPSKGEITLSRSLGLVSLLS